MLEKRRRHLRPIGSISGRVTHRPWTRHRRRCAILRELDFVGLFGTAGLTSLFVRAIPGFRYGDAMCEPGTAGHSLRRLPQRCGHVFGTQAQEATWTCRAALALTSPGSPTDASLSLLHRPSTPSYCARKSRITGRFGTAARLASGHRSIEPRQCPGTP